MKQLLNNYKRALKQALDSLDEEELFKIKGIIEQARLQEAKIFIIGNGGSAATALHFVNDINKMASEGHKKKFKAIALIGNVSLITAYANDECYSEIFKRQLENFLTQKDVLIAISVSGNSKNVISALKYAKKMKAITVGFLGFDGGEANRLVDYKVIVGNKYEVSEDAHSALCHILTNLLKKK